MITRLHVKNFKALRDVTVDVSSFHLLIGPNNSGKTSILQASYAICGSLWMSTQNAMPSGRAGRELITFDSTFASKSSEISVRTSSLPDFEYCVTFDFFSFNPAEIRYSPLHNSIHVEERLIVNSLPFDIEYQSVFLGGQLPAVEGTTLLFLGREYDWNYGSNPTSNEELIELNSKLRLVASSIPRPANCRFQAALLPLPYAVDDSGKPSIDEFGFGMVGVLEDIYGRERDTFFTLEKELQGLFPSVKRLSFAPRAAFKRVKPDEPQANRIPLLTPAPGKCLIVEMTDGSKVEATQLSEGILLTLGYLTLLYADPAPKLILVEEPENGIHPAKLRELLSNLRKIAKSRGDVQMIFTSHSPYVVSEFAPEEVSLCTREDGPNGNVKVTRLSDSPLVMDQIRFFTLGEVWTGEGDAAIADSTVTLVESSR